LAEIVVKVVHRVAARSVLPAKTKSPGSTHVHAITQCLIRESRIPIGKRRLKQELESPIRV
jgi:hypothetical protein